MVFRSIFNVYSLVLMFFLGLFLGHFRSKVFMLTLLIIFCLIYVLVRVCLGCWGYILKQSFLCSPVSLSWFPQSPTPVSTPNTCIVRGCQVSHLPLSFFSFLCFLFFADALIFNTSGRPIVGERTCANLSCVILCHLASLCRLALMLFFW